ncbi:MAG: hypothetical protein AAF529_08885 [Pseudomonadota bacterium]
MFNKMFSRIRLICLLPLMLLIGCAGNPIMEDATGKAVLRLAFDLAVQELVFEKDIEPERIVVVMTAAETFLQGDPSATVDQVSALVLEHIKFEDMEPRHAAFVRAVVPILAARVEAELAEKEILPEERSVAVREVLGWIRESAQILAT